MENVGKIVKNSDENVSLFFIFYKEVILYYTISRF